MSDETVQETPVEQTEQVQAAPVEDNKEYNMRVMRDRAEKAEQRARELERYVNDQALKAQQVSPEKPQEDEDDMGFEDDSYVEGKQIKKYLKEHRQTMKQVKKEQQELREKNAQSSAEIRLRSQYPDFDSVVNAENIQKLSMVEPEDYSSIAANPDWFAKGKTAYNMIKRYGLLDKYDASAKKAEDNKAKPRSVASAAPQAGNTPLANVDQYGRRKLSEADKDEINRRVAEIKKYR